MIIIIIDILHVKIIIKNQKLQMVVKCVMEKLKLI